MSKFYIFTQILQGKRIVFWKNLHSYRIFYLTAGRDGRKKFQVCMFYKNAPFLMSLLCALDTQINLMVK